MVGKKETVGSRYGKKLLEAFIFLAVLCLTYLGIFEVVFERVWAIQILDISMFPVVVIAELVLVFVLLLIPSLVVTA
ncbi:MAG: hypothetical protein ACW99J_19970, partial [Candidatus Thorarchaeota archaeon]